jgi:hypothetical protein
VIELLSMIFICLIAFVFLSAAWAPLGALGWWAGWFDRDRGLLAAAEEWRSLPRATAPAEAGRFAVFLTGVAAIDGKTVLPQDRPFLECLRAHAPEYIVVDDVFPYSVDNVGLMGKRRFGRIWNWVNGQVSANPTTLVRWPINFHNLMHVAVSADRRYGPVYNLGVAAEILVALAHHGYRPERNEPITLIGSSGGAQIALGAATYLRRLLDVPLQVVTIGGAMSDDIGLFAVDRLDSFYGTQDPVPTIVARLYPGRWPIFPWSPWNRALAEGKIRQKAIGPMRHDQRENYFDPETQLPSGQSYADHTAEEVAAAMEGFRRSLAPVPAAKGHEAA